ncbi:MAG: SAM-dependent methyltransferase, partial [Sphingomicrobium sp.]
MTGRGEHLVRADRGFAVGGGVAAWLVSPAIAKVLDQLDARLASGGIEGTLPDGSPRRIGFRGPGPVAVVQLKSWMGLVRLATSGSVGWYKAWAAGEWDSPDPVPLFELSAANALSLRNTTRAKGPARWINATAHRLRDNGLRNARRNIASHYDLGNDFYA